MRHFKSVGLALHPHTLTDSHVDVDVDVERKQAQAIASLPDSITHYYAYFDEDFTVILLPLPVP